jgi:cellobiose dehydrogenase (acceptor)
MPAITSVSHSRALNYCDLSLTITAKRIGPLTQAAPDIGPMMWEEITGPDGIVRQMQWTARVEGSNGEPDGGK